MQAESQLHCAEMFISENPMFYHMFIIIIISASYFVLRTKQQCVLSLIQAGKPFLSLIAIHIKTSVTADCFMDTVQH